MEEARPDPSNELRPRAATEVAAARATKTLVQYKDTMHASTDPGMGLRPRQRQQAGREVTRPGDPGGGERKAGRVTAETDPERGGEERRAAEVG